MGAKGISPISHSLNPPHPLRLAIPSHLSGNALCKPQPRHRLRHITQALCSPMKHVTPRALAEPRPIRTLACPHSGDGRIQHKFFA